MAWDDGLLPEQRKAASHVGSHARLLAGPGTGKTFTIIQHIRYLIEEQKVDQNSIRVISFTRATAGELCKRLDRLLQAQLVPTTSTLHSFALSELLSQRISSSEIIFPIRIPDDWEEKNIIHPDISNLIGVGGTKRVAELFKLLSADWESLEAESEDWEERLSNRDPKFIGAWREHRRVYGYTLRSEIVYQLKKAIEQSEKINIGNNIKYLIVDEYQDLNKCDLSVINYLAQSGAELYIAGDDDQSIYGFRKAHPEGIRKFPNDYAECEQFELNTCMRCASNILRLGLFVAEQDIRRIQKTLASPPDAKLGTVRLLRFTNQTEEALNIALLCQYLISDIGLKPSDILILLRSDKQNVFSKPILEELNRLDIPAVKLADHKLTDNDIRNILCFLRLYMSPYDSLSWRALLSNWCDRIGPKSIEVIYNMAREENCTFAAVVGKIIWDQSKLPENVGGNLVAQIRRIMEVRDKIASEALKLISKPELSPEIVLIEYVKIVALQLRCNDENLKYIIEFYQDIIGKKCPESIEELITHVTSDISESDETQDLDNVNILTMHKAKGLEAKAVIVVAVEDEYIPRVEEEPSMSEDRRLLYVSLTRAIEYLYITFCNRRTGQQMRTGRVNDSPKRTLTRFLQDAPLKPVSGKAYISNLGENNNDS